MRRRGWTTALGLGLLLLLAAAAMGDEPPPPEEKPSPPEEKAAPPPPEETPAPPPVVEKDEPAPVEPAWSPPARPIPRETGESALPPPTIRLRSRGTPAPEPQDARIRDVPSELPGLVPEAAPATDRRPLPAPAAARDDGAAGDGRLPIAMTPSMVRSISKTHNVPRADDLRALRLDVEYEVVGEAGRRVYVGVWFVRRESGRYLRSAMWQYGDPQGYLTVQTRPARIGARCTRYVARLEIPYAAFPMKSGEEEYEVEARVHVLRQERGSMMTVLARGETTFTVHATPLPAVEGAAQVGPAPACPAPCGPPR